MRRCSARQFRVREISTQPATFRARMRNESVSPIALSDMRKKKPATFAGFVLD